MSFSDRFELLDLVRDNEGQTFRAREHVTGRNVEVHFAASPEILARLDAQGGSVIDRGTHEGKFYTVTAPLTLDSAGAWRVKPSAPAPSSVPPPSAPPSAEPGDFTRMFQLRQAPEPVAVSVTKPAQPSPASLPGEFTRAFQKPASAVSVAPSAASEPGQPGEFTRMFQTPGTPPVQSVPAVPAEAVPALVPDTSAPVSQPKAAGSTTAPRVHGGLPAGIIVAIVVVLSAIAVFVLMRTLY